MERLLDLEERSHPTCGRGEEKELDSISALVWVERLVNLLAGWAIDHQAGLVVNQVEGFPWKEGDEDAAAKANDHKNELVGAEYLAKRSSTARDHIVSRKIIAAVADRAALLPRELRRELGEALKDQEYGQIQDLLEPTKHQKGSLELWRCQLMAIEHVYFLRGMKDTKEKAIRAVADAYCVSTDAVAGWDKKSLKEKFGQSHVEAAKQRARAFSDHSQSYPAAAK